MSVSLSICSKSGPHMTTSHDAFGQSQVTQESYYHVDLFKLVHLVHLSHYHMDTWDAHLQRGVPVPPLPYIFWKAGCWFSTEKLSCGLLDFCAPYHGLVGW